MTRAAVSAPFRFFDLSVVRTARIGSSVVRVAFGGAALAGLTSGGRDQRIKLFLPHPHQETPVVPSTSGPHWFGDWRAMDPAERAVMRTYTILEQRRAPEELDVDFAVHGDAGPASRWAVRACRDDRVVVLGPVEADNGGIDFRPADGTGWVLLVADESALPAVERILDWLPAGTAVRAWVEVPDAGDIRDLPTEADAEVRWLVRGSGDGLLDSLRAAHLPAGRPYAWIAGEAGTVRAVRRHLVGQRGFDRNAVTFTGYWRRGAAEDDLIAESVGEER